MAAEPNVVEKIAAFLADNELTRSWAQGVDNVLIRPVEKMMVDDAGLRRAVYNQIAAITPDAGGLSKKQIELLSAIKGAPVNAEVLNAGVIAAPDRRRYVLDQAHSGIVKYNPDRSTLLDVFDQIPSDGRTGMTETGDYVRQFGLGSPVAAYSAVTAGGALGIAAALAAYEQLVNQQQQQTAKVNLLPLQGEV